MQALEITSEDMALRNDDKVWIADEIAKAIREHLEPHGWRKLAFILRQLGPIVASIGVIVTLLGITAGSLYQSFARVDKEARFEQSTTDRLGAIEETLHAFQRSQVNALLDSAIREAKAKQKEIANQHIEQATEMLQALTKARVPAPESFFQSIVKTLDQLRPTGIGDTEVHQTALKLADYRSSLQPAPEIPRNLKTVQLPVDTHKWSGMLVTGTKIQMDNSVHLPRTATIVGNGAVLNVTDKFPKGADVLIPESRSLAENKFFIEGIVVFGGSQTLDGIDWRSTVFINTHIRYLGGDLKLTNVTFVNCVFDAVPSPTGVKFVEYAALGLPAFNAG